MKIPRKILILINLTLLFLLEISMVKANPVVVPLYVDIFYMTFILIMVFIINTIIEYSINYISFKNYVLHNRELYKIIVMVNLVTFPLTQVFAYIISLYFMTFFFSYIIFIEFLVIIAEWSLLKIELSRLVNKFSFKFPIKSLKIFHVALLSNVTSFLIGLTIFLPNYIL